MDKQITFPQAIAVFDVAMDKIRDEMANKHTNMAIEAIGEIMTAHLQAHPDCAHLVNVSGKTLEGAYKAMEDYAKSNRGGKNCVAIAPKKATEIILGYYGIDAEGLDQPAAPAAPAASAARERDEFDIDALLEV